MERLKLLIVEDDFDQRALLQDTLERHFGADTVTAAGSIGEALQENLASFDLILSDFNLPDGTGLDMLAKSKARCQTPVILVTGQNVGRTAAEAILVPGLHGLHRQARRLHDCVAAGC